MAPSDFPIRHRLLMEAYCVGCEMPLNRGYNYNNLFSAVPAFEFCGFSMVYPANVKARNLHMTHWARTRFAIFKKTATA